MRYVGIDYHKRYSVLCATDERGQELKRRRISGNSATGFAQFFSELGEESKVVMEACWNWGWLYDLLAKIEGIDEVVLAHPDKTRLIAEAQIKTDRLDAQMLAKLLRGDLIAQSHAPSAATRARKHSFTAAALLGPATHDVAQSDARDFGSTTRARAAAIEKLFQPARPNLVGRGAVALC